MAMTLDGTNGAFLPTWTTATRPASPANGLIGYNSTTGQLDQYVGSAWASVPTGSASSATPTAAGVVFGKTLSSGDLTTALGYQAGNSISGASENVAIGYRALYSDVGNSYCVAVGSQSLLNNVASSNTAVGFYAMRENTSGGSNVALGGSALQVNTSGGSNVAVGQNALVAVTTASNHVAVGYQAGSTCTTAVGMTFIGYQAGKNTTNNGNTTAVGYQALVAQTSGFCNTAVGDTTLNGITSGYHNTAIGHGVAQTLTTGTFNTYLGANGVASSSGVNNEIVINAGGSTTGKGAYTGFINPNTGGIYQGNNSSTWSTTSDRRLKKNIVDNNEGLDKLTQIQVRNFEYRTEEEVTELPTNQVIKKSGVQLGVIAQELQAVLPDCVKEETTGVLRVDSDNLTWYLINAVKELKAELDALKAKVA
jgi:hypothetical protein